MAHFFPFLLIPSRSRSVVTPRNLRVLSRSRAGIKDRIGAQGLTQRADLVSFPVSPGVWARIEHEVGGGRRLLLFGWSRCLVSGLNDPSLPSLLLPSAPSPDRAALWAFGHRPALLHRKSSTDDDLLGPIYLMPHYTGFITGSTTCPKLIVFLRGPYSSVVSFFLIQTRLCPSHDSRRRTTTCYTTYRPTTNACCHDQTAASLKSFQRGSPTLAREMEIRGADWFGRLLSPYHPSRETSFNSSSSSSFSSSSFVVSDSLRRLIFGSSRVCTSIYCLASSTHFCGFCFFLRVLPPFYSHPLIPFPIPLFPRSHCSLLASTVPVLPPPRVLLAVGWRREKMSLLACGP